MRHPILWLSQESHKLRKRNLEGQSSRLVMFLLSAAFAVTMFVCGVLAAPVAAFFTYGFTPGDAVPSLVVASLVLLGFTAFGIVNAVGMYQKMNSRKIAAKRKLSRAAEMNRSPEAVRTVPPTVKSKARGIGSPFC